MQLRRVDATRYVTPLREGGSLPALVEASDDGLYVLKFRGAGQGPKALVAEVVAGELARKLGFAVPELTTVTLDPSLGRAEPDAEIQDLLLASAGLNLGVDFLPGALGFNPAAGPAPEPGLAAEIVWLDALITNVDRTARNTNMLVWHQRLWLIDHGASLYFHHASVPVTGGEQAAFDAIDQHVLLPFAGSIAEADGRLAPLVTGEVLDEVVASIPPEWLDGGDPGIYRDYLTRRLEGPRRFVLAAEEARERSSPYSYALHRVVPRVDRGERINVGVVLFSRPLAYLGARTALDEARLAALFPELDPQTVLPNLRALERIAAGDPDAGPIATLDQTARFHWLVSPSSTIIQPSSVHTGVCDDPAAELDKLFQSLVAGPRG